VQDLHVPSPVDVAAGVIPDQRGEAERLIRDPGERCRAERATLEPRLRRDSLPLGPGSAVGSASLVRGDGGGGEQTRASVCCASPGLSASGQCYPSMMGFGIFIHRSDSIYADIPAERYQFPRQYLGRVSACIGGWIIYYEPSKVLKPKGYYATARVQRVIDDPNADGMHYAIIEPGSYLEFPEPVPFNGPLGIVERSVLNELGGISGRAQAAVRVIPADDYRRITELGLGADDFVLPRIGEPSDLAAKPTISGIAPGLRPEGFGDQGQAPLFFEQDRVRVDFSRPLRDRIFRSVVLQAYDQRCAVTGLKLVNGGGRAEVEAAHIKSVKANGPDMVSNGIALSGTAHWMFDRGLISIADDLTILISRQVNDLGSVTGLLNRSGKALQPSRLSDRPHPAFLQWHRDNCFKN